MKKLVPRIVAATLKLVAQMFKNEMHHAQHEKLVNHLSFKIDSTSNSAFIAIRAATTVLLGNPCSIHGLRKKVLTSTAESFMAQSVGNDGIVAEKAAKFNNSSSSPVKETQQYELSPLIDLVTKFDPVNGVAHNRSWSNLAWSNMSWSNMTW